MALLEAPVWEQPKPTLLGPILDQSQVRWAIRGDFALGRRLETGTLEETEMAAGAAVVGHPMDNRRTQVLETRGQEQDSQWEETRR